MLNIRRISSSRWWHKKKSWILLGIFLFLVFVRISKGSLYSSLRPAIFSSMSFVAIWETAFSSEPALLVSKNISFEDQVSSIISLYSNGKIEEALRNVNKYIEGNSEEAILFNIKGACYSELGQSRKLLIIIKLH